MPFFSRDNALQTTGEQILEKTWKTFPSLARNQVAMTWLVYDPPTFVNTGGALTPAEFWQRSVRGFSYRGVECIYPASVAKLFYLVAAHEWLQQNMVGGSAELDRALRDMIVDSSNDATGLVVDILTGTTSGPELPPAPFETWKQQRNIINRYFQSLQWEEFATINICQKTWGDGPYGRERAFYGDNLANRNMLTSDATARLLHSIVGGVAVSADRSQQMMRLLARSLDPRDLTADPENQIVGFIGSGLPPTAQIWSKAGWMSQARHDAAYVEIPGQLPFLLVIFTEGRENSANEAILPFITQQVVEQLPSLQS
ncbi:serine hydrolase [Alkalinema pantanalense CENA528]|uniref:serine hydrolase n=1 Tax=Alkalinema pantanalense TaxID=1620705 RepID=UPI003D6E17F7